MGQHAQHNVPVKVGIDFLAQPDAQPSDRMGVGLVEVARNGGEILFLGPCPVGLSASVFPKSLLCDQVTGMGRQLAQKQHAQSAVKVVKKLHKFEPNPWTQDN